MHTLEKITFGESLSSSGIRQIIYYINLNFLVLLPSDTGYSLATRINNANALKNISKLLEHDHSPIPLSFGTISMIEKYVELLQKDNKILDAFTPGPITIVCSIKSNIEQGLVRKIESLLHTNKTIGVRFPDSSIERQISCELNEPITTCAVRDDKKNIVTDYSEAVDIIRMHQEMVGDKTPIVGIKIQTFQFKHNSTVITMQKKVLEPGQVFVYRHGEVEVEKLENCLTHINWEDIKDFT